MGYFYTRAFSTQITGSNQSTLRTGPGPFSPSLMPDNHKWASVLPDRGTGYRALTESIFLRQLTPLSTCQAQIFQVRPRLIHMDTISEILAALAS